MYQAGLFSAAGQQQFLTLIGQASLPLLVLSVLVGVSVNMVSAFKWYVITQSQGIEAGYWRIFAYYVVGQFYNMFLPTSVGGDVVRSYELGKYSGRQADALASVFVERYTGVVVLLVCAGLAVLAQLSRFYVDYVIVSLIVFALALLALGWMVFDPRLYKWLENKLASRSLLIQNAFRKVDKLFQAVGAYRSQPRVLIVAVINSVLFYFIAVVNVYVTANVFSEDVLFWHMLLAAPIIMLIMNLPISFGNIGLMEFAYTNVFMLMGYGPELGLSVALLMRLKSFVDGAIGGVLHPLFVTQKHE
ncbi:hypothetical protein GCM10008090_09150 [Arenicella chitinivorans]|uniref:Flippase-like domain-containing protein n=2 Tax=Arenicella chitinivorans TaxID=1329800 RepID=A0A918RKV0_9GAMM|nr:hypothetical protein GCM10008090_09150 [Arenicella chitinivorans]